MNQQELKELINRQLRIAEVISTEVLSTAAYMELNDIAAGLGKEVKKVQDSGGVPA